MADNPRKIELIQTLTGDAGYKYASRVASSREGELVVCDKTIKAVDVYRYHKEGGKYEKKVSLNLKEGDGKLNAAALPKDGKIWLGRGSGNIEKYSATGEYESTVMTQEPEANVYSLDATAGDTVVAGDTKHLVITIHDLAGAVQKRLKTTNKPCQVLRTTDNHLAFSRLHSHICKTIDTESEQEGRDYTINMVLGVVYDKETGCLLVGSTDESDEPGHAPCDIKFGTGKIEQYSMKTGKVVTCLAEKLYCPRGMAITPDGVLAVADEENVKLYRLKF